MKCRNFIYWNWAMKYLLLGIVLAALTLAVTLPRQAGCVYCHTIQCTSGGCNAGCVCLVESGEIWGRCVSLGD